MASVSKREWTNGAGIKKTAWVVRYTDHEGKKRLRTFEQKKTADTFRLKIDTEIATGELVAVGDETFGAAADLFFARCEARIAARDLRPMTLVTFRVIYRRHIKPYLAKRKLRDLTLRELQKWIDQLAYDSEHPRRRPTLEHCAPIVKLIFAHAEKVGLCRNPLKAAKLEIPGPKSKPVAIPTKDEVRALLAAATGGGGVGSRPARWLKPLLHLAVFSGLRMGEMRALRWDHVDLKACIIKVRVAADLDGRIDEPKTTNGIRDVPIAPPLATVLKEWRLASPVGAQLVFVCRRGEGAGRKMLHPRAIGQSWCGLQKRVFGEGTITRGRFHFHALRHVAASLFIEAGLPPKRIQRIMGHASITMTFDRYGHLFEDPEMIEAAMSKIGVGLVG